MKPFNFTFWLSVGLILGGFFSPPIGDISGNVLSAVGLDSCLCFMPLRNCPKLLAQQRTTQSVTVSPRLK